MQGHTSVISPGAAPASLAGRVLATGICLPFIVGGVLKLMDIGATAQAMAYFHLPLPGLTALLVIALELGGSALVVFGSRKPAIAAALALAVFTVAASFLAHAFWRFEGEARFTQTNIFLEHLALASALVYLAFMQVRKATAGESGTAHPGS